MRVNRNIILTAAVRILLPTAGLTGCVDSPLDEGQGGALRREGMSYVMFNITSVNKGGRTRADGDPASGERGDGRERGQEYENEVSTVAVFLYQDEDGVNGSEYTPVTLLYFDDGEVRGAQNTSDNIDYVATTVAREVELEAGHYNVLAIANPQDLRWAGNDLTLGTLRDHIETSAWVESTADGGATYSSFLMTSENGGRGVTLEYNPEREPAVATVDVERMAARIDYRAEGTYTITAEDDATYAGASVVITGASIVNNLTAGSYEMKRVSGGLGQDVTYLGEETVDTEGNATNYVIDPWTEQKRGTNDLGSLYGVHYPGHATEGEEQNPSFWAGIVTTGTPVIDEDDGTEWNIVGYTMENTTYAEYTSKEYSTALVFAATFTPAEGTVRNSFYTDYGFVYGESTFFKWNNVLYATAEDMMAAAYPDTFVLGDTFGSDTFSGIEDMDGLRTFIATLRDDDPTGYKAYLQGFGTFPADKSSLYWANYMSAVHGYTFGAAEGVGLGETTRGTLNAATGGAVSTYEDSQCYYTWWIRHSNDGGDGTNGVMEYSIARNNIYKVRVNSVYSIGGDIPQEGVRAYVYVRNWTMLPSETIDL